MKKLKEELKYGKKGITLISLVVTIIVLLILAGVSIATLTGDNGLLTRANEAETKTEKAKEDELRELTQAEAATHLEEYEYEDESGKKVTIPPQCSISQVEGENTLDDGLVIIDANGNEWVWIEVPRTTVFTTAKNSNEYDALKTDLINYVGDYKKGSNEQNYNWTDEWYDSNGNTTSQSSNLNDTSGCGLTSSQYTLLYQKMLSSVYTNEGFWIGRYEAGVSEPISKTEEDLTETAKSQKDMYPYTSITCSQAQKLASSMSPDNSKTSSLMFGIQWDLVCKYLESRSDFNEENINSDSGSWGNYASVSFSVSNGSYAVLDQRLSELQNWSEIYLSYEKISSGAENKVLFTTGATKRNSKMNIYDMAGNAIEWTLEHAITKYTDSPCTFRGGSYAHVGSERPLAYRGFTTTIYSNFGYSFRSVLY